MTLTVTLNILCLLVFIASISLLHKILNACQNEINRIVAYTFLNVREKITSFCQVLKKMHTEENWFQFFLPHGV